MEGKRFLVNNFTTSIDKGNTQYWSELFVRLNQDVGEQSITYVRTNIFTELEFIEFKKTIEEESRSSFSVEKCKLHSRWVWSKQYRCHHGTHNIKSTANYNPRKKTGCFFRLSVRIKVITGSTKRKDRMVATHPCLIVFEGGHSHPMATVRQLSVLPVSTTTKMEIEDLFRSGLTPAAASLQIARGKSVSSLADASVNPHLRSIYYQYHKYNTSINGDLGGDKMWELVAGLQGSLPGVRVAFQRESPEDLKDMAIAIITPLMSRVHETIPQAAEILFVDTTSHIDLLNTNVTLMLTWSPMGAVPLGVLLSDCQTERAYKQGFELWKSILPAASFYGTGSPQVIMTDDSDAERGALSSCFPTATLLLCNFHTQQAMWRWLWDSKHKIILQDRQVLMKLFRHICTAKTMEKFHEAVVNLRQDPTASGYDGFIKHVNDLLLRATSFALAFRTCDLTRGHDTNNFAEATIRIFKEVILGRRKAFNTYELAVVIAEGFEEVFVHRMLDVALGRRKVLHSIPIITSTITGDMIIKESDHEFIVRGEFNPENAYSVDTSLMLCLCPAGNGGKFCKHLSAIERFHPDSMHVNRMTTPQERYQLAVLATGDSTSLNPALFGLNVEQSAILAVMPSTEAIIESISQADVDSDDDFVTVSVQEADIERANAVVQQFNKLVTDRMHDPNMRSALASMSKAMNKMSNSNSIISAVHMFGREGVGISGARCSKKIRVQPTGIARRGDGKPRGASALSRGRPIKRKGTKLPQETVKRPRNLATNISHNRPNAKSHGLSH